MSPRVDALLTHTEAEVPLAARSVGLPKDSDWGSVDEPAPAPGDGRFMVENTGKLVLTV